MGKKKRTDIEQVLEEADFVNQVGGAFKVEDDKAAAFVRLGNDRLNGVLDAIAKLEKLSDKRNYSYDNAQITVISEAIANRTNAMIQAFAKGGTQNSKKEWL